MTVFPLSMPAGRLIRIPTRQEVTAMLATRAGFIVAVLAALVAFLAVLASVVYLVATGHDTSAVTGLLGGSMLVLVLNLRSKVNDLHTKVDQGTGGN